MLPFVDFTVPVKMKLVGDYCCFILEYSPLCTRRVLGVRARWLKLPGPPRERISEELTVNNDQ